MGWTVRGQIPNDIKRFSLFRNAQAWGASGLLFNGYRDFFPPRLTTHLHLVSRLRMSDAITLLLLDVLRCFRHSIQRNAAMLPLIGLDPFPVIFKSSLMIRSTTRRDTVWVLTASSSTPQKEYTYALTHKVPVYVACLKPSVSAIWRSKNTSSLPID